MSTSDWWANKLGAAAPKPAPNLGTPTPQYVAPQPATYVQPQSPQYPPSQQATPPAPRCPSCHSANYSVAAKQITQNGQVESWRCYDCGYPLVQAGSGLGGANSAPRSGSAQPAVQVPTGGWNPQTIIGHI